MDPILDKLIDLALTAGPFGAVMMTIMWWIERKDRLALSAKNDVLVERVLNGLNSATEAVRENSKAILLAMNPRGGDGR